METKNKKILFLGDSITEFYCASSIEKCYASLVTELGEFREGKNYGVGGTRFAKQTKELYAYREPFYERAARMERDADIIVIFGGTNDYGHGDAPIGKFGDATVDTFYGAVDCLLKYLTEEYPTARLVLITPLHRTEEERELNEFGVKTTGTLRDYVEAEIRVAEKYSVPVLDLYRLSGICPNASEVNRNTYTADGLHPNDLGHRIIAEKLLSFIKNVL